MHAISASILGALGFAPAAAPIPKEQRIAELRQQAAAQLAAERNYTDEAHLEKMKALEQRETNPAAALNALKRARMREANADTSHKRAEQILRLAMTLQQLPDPVPQPQGAATVRRVLACAFCLCAIFGSTLYTAVR